MERTEYVALIGDLLSGDPEKLRSANRQLYTQTVVCDRIGVGEEPDSGDMREADLALAEIAQ